MKLTRKLLRNVLIIINLNFWVVFLSQYVLIDFPLKVGLNEIFTLLFSSALVYFSYTQVKLNERQSRYYIELNRPRLFCEHYGNEVFRVYNKGQVPAWNISVAFCRSSFDPSEDKQIQLKGTKTIFPQEHFEIIFPTDLFNLMRHDVGLRIKFSYYDREDKGYNFQHHQYVNLN